MNVSTEKEILKKMVFMMSLLCIFKVHILQFVCNYCT